MHRDVAAKLRALAFLSLAALAGCTYLHEVGGVPPQALGRRVTVQTWRGDRFLAVGTPTPTGIAWRTPQGMALDARDLAVVEIVSPGGGLLEGLGVGLLLGVGGAALGWLSGDDHCGREWICIRFTAEEKAAMFGLALGVPGVVIGGAFGLAKGRRDVYVISGASL